MNEPLWLTIANQELGIHEIPGPEAEQRIIEYDSFTTLKATSDEVPWCSSFVNFCIAKARLQHPELDKPTYSAAAMSWVDWGEEIEFGRLGCIVVFEWNNGGHHVAFYLDEKNKKGLYQVKCRGGNQDNSVNDTWFLWDNIISFRWPKNYFERS